LQNGNDLVFSESGFTHRDLLTGHNQYVGRSLKVNGSVYRDAYNFAAELYRFPKPENSLFSG
ncbi:hypothetical protein, partial [Serratia marcescens]|uniref:hypothetical protein n=1 Tax=Serratia marcescens TaxID=615 RepID=UPI00332DE481